MTFRASVETVPNPKFCKLGPKCEILPAVRSIPCLIIFTVCQKPPSAWRIERVYVGCASWIHLKSSQNMKKNQGTK